METVNPGDTVTHMITVSTKATDPSMDIVIDTWGFGQTPAKSYSSLSAADDTSPYSARKFITLDTASFHLNPGESKKIKATIVIPSDVGDGGRYAIISLHNAPSGDGTTAYITAISVPVMITIAKSSLIEAGSITDIKVGDIVTGQPLMITTLLKNTGNIHYYQTKNTVTVSDNMGTVIGTASTAPSVYAIIPNYTVDYDVTLDTSLSPGTYSVKSEVSLEDGTLLDSKTSAFEVKSSYIAPSPDTSVTLTPQESSVLASSDGRISISFPAGAVINDITVTLKPFSRDQLPTILTEAKAGGTCFQVEGLSGILSKDATISVKYSDADLAVAGGDASNLVLARYDQSDSRWTQLTTTVNKDTTTLSATTNRFSTWAVMTASSQFSPTAGQQGGIMEYILSFLHWG
ncbi:MAG: hypothetical protein LUQ66_08155 [Methanoregula sp.]|nr:hypothetical protein [Methanoregula sp.]